MKFPQYLSTSFLAFLACLGLSASCGEIDTPVKSPLPKSNSEISKALDQAGRIKFEHSSTLKTTGGSCGSRTNF